jgi:hypothetical protein
MGYEKNRRGNVEQDDGIHAFPFALHYALEAIADR